MKITTKDKNGLFWRLCCHTPELVEVVGEAIAQARLPDVVELEEPVAGDRGGHVDEEEGREAGGRLLALGQHGDEEALDEDGDGADHRDEPPEGGVARPGCLVGCGVGVRGREGVVEDVDGEGEVGEQQRAGDEGARYATCGRACTFHWPLLLCLWEREKCSLIRRGSSLI